MHPHERSSPDLAISAFTRVFRRVMPLARLKVAATQAGIILALILGWELAPNWLLEELLWSRPSATSPMELRDLWTLEQQRWADVIRTKNIRAE